MDQIHVVGLGMDHGDLPPTIAHLIGEAEVLVGGSRLIEMFQDHPAVKIPIKSPLDKVIKEVAQEMGSGKNVVVLADGDPGFFGIGKKLIEVLGKERVRLCPNVTALQTATSRIKIPWDNIVTLSLHGRKDLWPLFRALVNHDLVAVYTDQDFHPGRIAEALIGRGVDAFRMHVFENLGRDEERIGSFDLPEAKPRTYSSPNFIILERVKQPEIVPRLGLDDDLYLHEKGLITKREIRAVGLANLEIQPSHTLWDLGAGCGSVAIEASLLANEGRVLAVEKNASRAKMIRQNIRRTGAYGVEVIQGDMPGSLRSLADPDRIFMGGGLGKDTGVLKEALARLKRGGKMVIHLVLMGSLFRARDYLLELTWPFTITQVQVSRSQDLAGDQRMAALNPVHILCATKPAKDT